MLVLIINGVEETIPLLNNVSLTDNCNILFLLIELLSVFGPNSLLSYDKRYILDNDDVLLVLIINGVEESIPLPNNVSLTDNCIISFLLIELLSVVGPNSRFSYDKRYVEDAELGVLFIVMVNELDVNTELTRGIE